MRHPGGCSGYAHHCDDSRSGSNYNDDRSATPSDDGPTAATTHNRGTSELQSD